MTAEKIRKKYNVSVMKFGYGKRAKWHAYRGGNGTGAPVEEIAEAYHLVELAKRVAKKLALEVK